MLTEEKRKPFYRRFTKKFFVSVNIFFALLLIVSCYGARLDPSTWWFMGLLNLSMPFILLVILLFFIFWILFKPVWSLLPVITVIACWGPISNLIPFNFSESFKIEKQDGRLRVMTWNVEHFDIEHAKTAGVREQMLDLIQQYKPDVACFQEMVGSDSPNAINYLADIQSRLAFTGYYFSYNPKLDFDPHHHFGIITFSRYPIVNRQTVSEYPHDYNSIFQYTDILYNSDTFRIINVHLQSLRFDENNLSYLNNPTVKTDSTISESKSIIKKLKVGFLKRAVQAKRVHDEVVRSPYPVIVCGDFNDVPNSYAYNTIGNGLQNAFVKKGDGLGRTFMNISPTLRIDNIFADKRFEVEQFTRIRKKLSDHFPLFTDLLLSKTR